MSGFENYANEVLRKNTFNEYVTKQIIYFWNGVIRNTGNFVSVNICDRRTVYGTSIYKQVFHTERGEVIMEHSFGTDGLINGFYILRVIPKCDVYTVRLIPTGKSEYFLMVTVMADTVILL